jgi:gas vesicle protein
LLEQSDQATADIRDRVREGVEDISSRTRQAMRSPQSYVARDILTFAAGVSLGLGLGILFAPAPGYQTRTTIGNKVQEVGNKVRERFSAETERAAG